MKLLVTGATGFLGSHLVRAFLRQGHQVTIIKRSFSDTSRIAELLPQLVAYDIDACGPERPFAEMGSFDAVIHAATSYGRKGERISEIFEANTSFPLRLLEAAITHKAGVFFNTDTSLARNVNPYALSKKQFLDWGMFFAEQRAVRFVNIELEHFYGPGDDASKFTTHVITTCLNDEPELRLTRGEQRRDFIHIDDVVSAYLLLLEKASAGPGNFRSFGLGSGEAVSVREFVETVHRIVGSKTFLNFGAIPYRENEVMETEADIGSLRALGWRHAVTLTEGIARTVDAERKKPASGKEKG
ncbi:NAD(P)-dependent oxidoreductase [Geobacter sp.]|uniref:NAD-dependent epimerase/dehydratase family protein n=1 Tax=Geobacter sp. TaxID=46610 RepID=UPI0026107A63|nr:NAD(P)-dependent oxidoreductase [Geobacter sp.]